MAQEIEVRFRLTAPEGLQARLHAAGAKRVPRVLETNRILDTGDRRLLAADCGLRVREWHSLDGRQKTGATLTFKGPRSSSQVKSREEVETPVADATATLAILERLGFREAITYQKRREEWRLGECVVALDELPQLGWYVEIEGPAVSAVDAARARLDLTDVACERDTYVHLAEQHGQVLPDGPRRLMFPT